MIQYALVCSNFPDGWQPGVLVVLPSDYGQFDGPRSGLRAGAPPGAIQLGCHHGSKSVEFCRASTRIWAGSDARSVAAPGSP